MICVVLSFLLARILITPIQALTVGTRQVAAGDFSQRVAVEGHDEIGVLARNFNHMAKVLEDTISEAENERNKLDTLFLHMSDGVVAYDAAASSSTATRRVRALRPHGGRVRVQRAV